MFKGLQKEASNTLKGRLNHLHLLKGNNSSTTVEVCDATVFNRTRRADYITTFLVVEFDGKGALGAERKGTIINAIVPCLLI